MNKPETIILSLGGSLIVPNQVDTQFVKKFVQLIEDLTPKYRFVIFTGGGMVARNYQKAATAIQPSVTADAKDWIGITASWLNAELVKQSLGRLAHSTIITDPRVKLRWSTSVWVGAGWKPGRSTDYDAVRIAQENSITRVINLSNIDYVYTKDPRKFTSAERITSTTWSEFRALVGSTWDPGLNVPFDPIAARLAQQAGISVAIMNGKKLANVKAAIIGKSFTGTEIR